MNSYCILQLLVFVCRPMSCTCRRRVDVAAQDIIPSLVALSFRPTLDQRNNDLPLFITVKSYRILQRLVVVCRPMPCTYRRRIDVEDQGVMSSVATLYFRSIRNQRGTFLPIGNGLLFPLLLALIRYCTSQLFILFWCPVTMRHIHHWI
jgi:hypothetical protein